MTDSSAAWTPIANRRYGWRWKLGCLLMYGRRTPPESVVMLGGQVQVWNRGDRDEMFRIFDTICDALGQDRA